MRLALFACLLSAHALVLGACEKRFSIGALRATGVYDDAGPGENVGGSVGGDGGVCARTGALYDVGDGPGALCEDGQRRAFRNAICSCGDVQNAGPITVDAFDSSEGAYAPGDPSGSMGVNGSFYPGPVNVGRSLWVAGANGIPLSANVRIGADLLDQGQLNGAFAVAIGGRAVVAGSINVQEFTASSLTVSETAMVAVAEGAPPYQRAAVAIPTPCDCRDPLDIGALVAAREKDNDNAAIGLDARESFRSINGAVELTLPCGRYYADAFYAPNPITLTITGPVELYVRGSMIADRAGTIDIQFAPGGEIDLFVEKGFSINNHLRIGWPNAPERARVYAGGGETLFFSGETTLGASVYAPRGELVSSGPFNVYGSLFVGRIASSGPLTVHYDRALARDECTPASCAAGESCGVLACKEDMCGECATDAECGAFLHCNEGLCLP
jgi:hypothetical protein